MKPDCSRDTEIATGCITDGRSDAESFNGRVARMEIKQIQAFLAVARHLNFTKAARSLGVAQPNLSQQIQSLEHQLGAALFLRDRRSVVLTREGDALVSYAERIDNITRAAIASVRAISRGEEGPLIMGVVASSIFSIVPKLLPLLKQSYPGIYPSILQMTISRQFASLRAGSIDVGLIRGPIFEPDLKSIILLSEGYTAVVPSGHALATRTSVPLKDVLSYPIIAIDASAGDFSRRVHTALTQLGLCPTFTHYASDTYVLLGLVSAGMGLSLVPSSLRCLQTPGITYVPIEGDTPITTLEAVYNPSNTSQTLKNLLKLLSRPNALLFDE
jgi:DNA-binding transcriptional LysR family regulator